MSEFRDRLKQAAAWAGVGENQADICRSLDLPRQTVNRWFMGGEANSEMLVRIAKAWGVDPYWLQSGKGNMLPPPRDLPEDELELLSDYRKASPPTRQVIRNMVRAAKKAVVTIATVIPPLVASPDSSAMRHNINCDAVGAAQGHITHWMLTLLSAFRKLRARFRNACETQDSGITFA